MNKEQNKKQVYVRPETKVLGVATEQHLLEFSGGHNDAGNDNDPMHAYFLPPAPAKTRQTTGSRSPTRKASLPFHWKKTALRLQHAS